MGTRFMCTQESPAHLNIKQAIVDNAETDTALILRSLRNSSRVARTQLAQSIIDMEKAGATIQEIGPKIAGVKGRKVYEEGDIEGGIWTVGMVQGLIHDIPTCAVLVRRIVDEAESIIEQRLMKLTGRSSVNA
jgi:nitronate monooxygenase